MKLSLDEGHQNLRVSYSPKSDKPLYDICDVDGAIIKTGTISGRQLSVQVSDLLSNPYILLILDGDQIRSKRFEINR